MHSGSSIHAMDARPYSNSLLLESSTLSFAPSGSPVGGDFADVFVRNSNVYGNMDGNWIGLLEEFENEIDNESADPEYCDPENEDFSRCPAQN